MKQIEKREEGKKEGAHQPSKADQCNFDSFVSVIDNAAITHF